MFREISETETLSYKPGSTDVDEMAAHGAKARCLEEGSLP